MAPDFLSALRLLATESEPWQFLAVCIGILLVLSIAFLALLFLARVYGVKVWQQFALHFRQRRLLKDQGHILNRPDIANSLGGVDLQDALLGKIIIADLREHLRAWGSLCAGLLQMIYTAKQRHPELFHHISAAQDQMAAAGQKIANCYEKIPMTLTRRYLKYHIFATNLGLQSAPIKLLGRIT